MPASPWPTHLLTLEEFAALPEDTSRHYELEEGVLIVSPRRASPHQRVLYRLQSQVNEQLPAEW